MNLPSKVRTSKLYSFTFTRCVFLGNRNTQVVGLSTNNMYYGSLIQMENVALMEPIAPQLISLTVADSQFRENMITGNGGSLIYAYKVQTQVYRS